jgi:hypothetical protein
MSSIIMPTETMIFLVRSMVLEIFFTNRDSDKGAQVVLGAAEEASLKLTCASCQKPG